MVMLREKVEYLRQNYLSLKDHEKWKNVNLVESYFEINHTLPDRYLKIATVDHNGHEAEKNLGDFWRRISSGTTKLKGGTAKLEELKDKIKELIRSELEIPKNIT